MKWKIPELKIPSLSKRERLMIVAGGAVLSLVLVDRLMWSPWLQYSRKLETRIELLSRTVSGQKLLLSRKGAVQQDMEAYKQFLKPGKSPEMEMADFLREIEQIGGKSGMSFQEVKPLTSNTSEEFQEFGLEVHFESQFSAWMRFIYHLETSPSLFVVERASVARLEPESPVIKGVIRIRKLVLSNRMPVSL